MLTKEIAQSVKDYVLEKFSSKFFSLFLFSWIIFHWAFLYNLLFLSQETVDKYYKVTKVDYLYSVYTSHFRSELIYLLYTFCLTLFLYYVLPKYFLEKLIYPEDERQRNEKRKIRREFEKIEVEKRKEALIEKKSVIDEEKVVDKKFNDIYDSEYFKFKESTYYSSFQGIKESILKNEGGMWYRPSDGLQSKQLTADELGYFIGNKVITQNNENKIKFTEKGLRFLELDYRDNLSTKTLEGKARIS